MTHSKTLVIVGCGAAKRDEPTRAADLYTSTYFAKKREYAETIGDEWLILSAEHALVTPDRELDPYETSIDDLDEDRLDALAHTVGMSLIDWIANEVGKGVEIEEIIVLAGRSYLDPLRERESFSSGIDPTVTFPLQTNDLGGIGEQMGWLSERVKTESAEQSRLVTDGGSNVSEDESSRPGGATAQCVGNTECSFYQRNVWEAYPAAVVLPEAHSRLNSRADSSSIPAFTQKRTVINQVNHWSGPTSGGGESEQQRLVTDGGQDSPGDVVYHVVCHGCDHEDVVEDDRVLAAVNEVLHRKRTGHAVEYAEIGGDPREC
ncbi:DUF6884 domain-containing protein [Halobellus rarus]|uniref:DUF6884 domain-containing protein n=1 Tax=Halobellus rarus TaxID=1126237 RepID=A0ABD6CMR4_9EURY|nr:DUF6884 domain-containing protein [Halobellus rarus]